MLSRPRAIARQGLKKTRASGLVNSTAVRGAPQPFGAVRWVYPASIDPLGLKKNPTQSSMKVLAGTAWSVTNG